MTPEQDTLLDAVVALCDKQTPLDATGALIRALFKYATIKDAEWKLLQEIYKRKQLATTTR